VRFRAVVVNQIFGGATDLLNIRCPDGTELRVRIPSRGPIDGEHEFEYFPEHAVRVEETGA
jgi:hypothetical protein